MEVQEVCFLQAIRLDQARARACGDQLPTSVMKHDGAAKVLAISGKSAGFRWFDAPTCL